MTENSSQNQTEMLFTINDALDVIVQSIPRDAWGSRLKAIHDVVKQANEAARKWDHEDKAKIYTLTDLLVSNGTTLPVTKDWAQPFADNYFAQPPADIDFHDATAKKAEAFFAIATALETKGALTVVGSLLEHKLATKVADLYLNDIRATAPSLANGMLSVLNGVTGNQAAAAKMLVAMADQYEDWHPDGHTKSARRFEDRRKAVVMNVSGDQDYDGTAPIYYGYFPILDAFKQGYDGPIDELAREQLKTDPDKMPKDQETRAAMEQIQALSMAADSVGMEPAMGAQYRKQACDLYMDCNATTYHSTFLLQMHNAENENRHANYSSGPLAAPAI